MRHPTFVLVGLLIGGLMLSGCLGGDDTGGTDAPATGAPDATPTAETGSVKGQVVTASLDEVEKASVAIMQGSALVATTETDNAGRFTFNDLAPAEYRVQVSSICCQAAAQAVTVTASKVSEVNFRLDFLVLEEPFVKEWEWSGFISCGVSTPAVAAAACSLFEDTPAEDPNEAFLIEFNVSKGIKSLVVGMDWDPVGGVSGSEFNLLIENNDCGFDACTYTYADLGGAGPLVANIGNDDITDGAYKWDAIGETRTLQFRVFAFGDATLIYQQPFSVYIQEHYWGEAPEDVDPIPDK